MTPTLTRRRFLGTTTAALSAPLSWATRRAAGQSAAAPLRLAHMTDIHVQPELAADQGFIQCLEAVHELEPQFILTGGDLVMDVFDQDAARADLLFDLYQRIVRDHTDLTVYPCLGNHDVFGWSNRRGVTPDHPQYGKRLFCDRFDRGGWRIYVLDDIQPTEDNRYQAYLDEAQRDWLERDLEAKPADMPALVVCHIPILSVTVLDTRGMWNEAENEFRIPLRQMAREALDLTQLFSRHNVRLALSGHTHRVDRVEYRGVTFICGGAVCGAWWREIAYRGFPACFGVVDLFPDGRFDVQFAGFEWPRSG